MDTERYFALPERIEPLFKAFLDTPAVLLSIDIDTLAGLKLIEARRPGPSREIARSPEACQRDEQTGIMKAAPRPFLVVAAIVTQLVFIVLLRLVSLRRVMAALARRHDALRRRAANETSVIDLAAAFNMANLVLGREGKCLPRTLAFVWMCWRRGRDVDLVIGVRINPFSAHCWSQSGEVVVNDTLDRVSAFEPIFVL